MSQVDTIVGSSDFMNVLQQRTRNSAVVLGSAEAGDTETSETSTNSQIIGCGNNNNNNIQQLPPIKPPSFPPPPPPINSSGINGVSNAGVYQSIIRQPTQLYLAAANDQHSSFYPSAYASTSLRFQGLPETEPFLPSPSSPVLHPCFNEYISFSSRQKNSTLNSAYANHHQQMPFYETPQPATILRAEQPVQSVLLPTPAEFEPAEAAVARPLAVIAFFFCCQFCFSIPALILAYRRNKQRSNYRASIGLSVTTIVLGICFGMSLVAAVAIYIFHGEKVRSIRETLFPTTAVR